MKVMTILGTRPEIIKMSEIIKKLDKYTDHVFVHTGQNYDRELGDIFYSDLGLRTPDIQLEWHGNDLGVQLASNFTHVSKILIDEKPDAVVILGDTNSAIAGGYIAKRMKIPLFHLEAGNRCFDDNVPEEINRKIMDHISDVNMVYTENSRRYLLDEGVAKDRIFVMGSPMKEIIVKHLARIRESKVLRELNIKKGEYFVVSIHRDENLEIPENLDILMNTLNLIAFKYGVPIIVSTHPRFRHKLDDNLLEMHKNIEFLKPLGFLDYVFLQANAKCTISDSGTIAEESSILGFPAVTIRNAIERPEAIDVGSILVSGVDSGNIIRCIDVVTDNFRPGAIPRDYDLENTSERVLRVVLGYTPYVNKYVWHK